MTVPFELSVQKAIRRMGAVLLTSALLGLGIGGSAVGVESVDASSSTASGPGFSSSVVVAFDNPPSSADKQKLNSLFGPSVRVASSRDIGVLISNQSKGSVPTAAGSGAVLNSSSVGFAKFACNHLYSFSDSDGTYTVQHACGGSTAPWGFKLSSSIRSIVVGNVAESGMSWYKNYGKQPTQASHLVDPAYQFHGTYNPVRMNDKVNYSDSFSFRHNVGGGGSAVVSISGAWYFYNG